MSRLSFENAIITKLTAVKDAVEGAASGGYTETLVFPGYDAGNGDNIVIEGHPVLRGRVVAIMGYHYTEANTDPIFSVGTVGDVDAYIEEITTAAVSANTNNATDADGAHDHSRFMLPGAAYVIPVSQLFQVDSIDGGADTGVYTFVLVVQYFE